MTILEEMEQIADLNKGFLTLTRQGNSGYWITRLVVPVETYIETTFHYKLDKALEELKANYYNFLKEKSNVKI
tara:strand:- start:3834 stop:4052 length:219 start_codon:yes stop_codon:yes gene_type:complete